MKKSSTWTAAFVAVVMCLVSIILPNSVFAQEGQGQSPPPTISQEDCTKYKAQIDLINQDPYCKGVAEGTVKPGTKTVVPPMPYTLLCGFGTTGQTGIHYESTGIAGYHCTCDTDHPIRVTGDMSGSGRYELCVKDAADLEARMTKLEISDANQTVIINKITEHQIVQDNDIAALGLDVDALKAEIQSIKDRLAALEGRVSALEDKIDALSDVDFYAGLMFLLGGRNGVDVGGGLTAGLFGWFSDHVGINVDATVGAEYEPEDPEIGAPLFSVQGLLGLAFRFGPVAFSVGFHGKQYNRVPHEAGGFEGNSVGFELGGGANAVIKPSKKVPVAIKVDLHIGGGSVAGAKDKRPFEGTMVQGGGGIGVVLIDDFGL